MEENRAIRKEIKTCAFDPYSLLADHFKPSTVRRLHQERPTLRFGCCEWMVGPLVEAGVDKRVIDLLSTDSLYEYNIAAIMAFPAIHDVPNCGYKLILQPSLETVFYCTDVGTLDGICAKNFDWFFVEANHHTADIEARAAEKLAKGEFAYEMRAAATHLSKEQAENWFYQNCGPNSKVIYLHGHEDKEKSNA